VILLGVSGFAVWHAELIRKDLSLAAVLVLLSNIAVLNICFWTLWRWMVAHHMMIGKLADEVDSLRRRLAKSDTLRSFQASPVDFEKRLESMESKIRTLEGRVPLGWNAGQAAEPASEVQISAPTRAEAVLDRFAGLSPAPAESAEVLLIKAVKSFVEVCRQPNLPAPSVLLAQIQATFERISSDFSVEAIYRDQRFVDNLVFFRDPNLLHSAAKYLMVAHPGLERILIPCPSPGTNSFVDVRGFEGVSQNESFELDRVRSITPGILKQGSDGKWALWRTGAISIG
jgi:hypothetical protein